MAQSTSTRLAANAAAGDTLLGWPGSVLVEFAVGLPQAYVSGMAGWMALQNELWAYGSAIRAELTTTFAKQATDLTLLPPWMVWHNGTEQLA
jgi:hypothetical protein